MNFTELAELQEKAKAEKSTLSDVVEIVSSAFLSSSKHSNEIKKTLDSILDRLNNLESRIEIVQRQTVSPIYQNVIDDDEENEVKTEEVEEIEK